MWSVPAGRWRTLADYAGVAAEIAAVIVIGLLITTMVLMLNPELARGASQGAVPGHLGATVAWVPSAEFPRT